MLALCVLALGLQTSRKDVSLPSKRFYSEQSDYSEEPVAFAALEARQAKIHAQIRALHADLGLGAHKAAGGPAVLLEAGALHEARLEEAVQAAVLGAVGPAQSAAEVEAALQAPAAQAAIERAVAQSAQAALLEQAEPLSLKVHVGVSAEDGPQPVRVKVSIQQDPGAPAQADACVDTFAPGAVHPVLGEIPLRDTCGRLVDPARANSDRLTDGDKGGCRGPIPHGEPNGRETLCSVCCATCAALGADCSGHPPVTLEQFGLHTPAAAATDAKDVSVTMDSTDNQAGSPGPGDVTVEGGFAAVASAPEHSHTIEALGTKVDSEGREMLEFLVEVHAQQDVEVVSFVLARDATGKEVRAQIAAKMCAKHTTVHKVCVPASRYSISDKEGHGLNNEALHDLIMQQLVFDDATGKGPVAERRQVDLVAVVQATDGEHEFGAVVAAQATATAGAKPQRKLHKHARTFCENKNFHNPDLPMKWTHRICKPYACPKDYQPAKLTGSADDIKYACNYRGRSQVSSRVCCEKVPTNPMVEGDISSH